MMAGMAYDLPPPPFQPPAAPVHPTGPAPADVPLDQPLYGATFGQAVSRFFRKYATFSGRASLAELWWAYLAQMIALGVLYLVLIVLSLSLTDPRTGEIPDDRGWPIAIPVLLLIGLALGTFLPMLAVIVRRLHDTGRSGWWYLISLVPLGSIVLLVLLCQGSTVTGFAYDPRNGQPGMAVHPILRAQQHAASYGAPGYGAPGYGAPGFAPPGHAAPPSPFPTDAPTGYAPIEDRRD